jgi:hypothetical protein
MKTLLVSVAVLALSAAAGALLGQPGSLAPGLWSEPVHSRVGRRDPVVPPAELYDVAARRRLQVSTILIDRRAPRRSRAVVRLGGERPTRAVVAAGDRVGAYRIVRVDVDRVVAVMRALGEDRSVVIPLAGDSARAASSN